MTEPTVTNDGLLYSIRDALTRIEVILANDDEDFDEYAQPANEMLTDLDEAAWNYLDAIEEAHDA